MDGQPAIGFGNRTGQVPGREVLPSGAPRKFFTFSFFMFLLVALTYFGLSVGYKAYLNQEIKKLETSLDELRFEVPEEEQEELIRFFSQVGNIKTVLDKHIITSNVFRFLEQNTHASIAFTDMDLSTTERKISLDGVAANYDALVAQMSILESVPEVERIVLDNSQLNAGAVSFRLTLTVDASVFDFKEIARVPQPIEESEETETQ